MAFIFFYITLYILLIISWRISKHDILSPGVLICLSFIGGSTMYVFGSFRLQGQAMTFTTAVYILVGIALFLFGCEICKMSVKSTRKYSDLRQYTAFYDCEGKIIKLPMIFFVGFAMLVIFTAIMQIQYVKSEVGGSIIYALATYREESLYRGNSGNTIVKLLSRIIFGVQPVVFFVVCHNRFISGKKFEHPCLMGIVLIAYMAALYLISGCSRGRIFAIFFQLLFAGTLALNYKGQTGNRSRYKKKGTHFWLKAVALIVIIGIPLFYYGGIIGGRDYSRINAFQSVENYFSYGLIRINLLINNISTVKSENWGQWSFPGIYSFLNKLHIVSSQSYDFFPFYKNYGNTVTIFGRWYVDFGVFGIVVMSFVTGCFYSYFYYRLKYTNSRKIALKYSCLYIFLYSSIIMASYDDWVRSVLTLNGLFQIAIILFVTRWLCRKYLR